MDKKIANNIIVGVMVSIGMIAFVFVLFTIGSGGILQSQYRLYGTFRQVKGLHMGSEVALAGLRIGVIQKITIGGTNKQDLLVEMSLSRSVEQYIRKDSIAQIRTQGVLGDKYVEISFGSDSSPVLKSGDSIQTDEPEDLLSQSGKLVGGISKKFSDGGDFDSLMRNLNVLSKNLAAMSTDLRNEKTSLKVGKAVNHLEAILSKVDRGEGTLGALISDPTVYEDIKSITGGAKRSAILQYFMKQFRDEGQTPGP